MSRMLLAALAAFALASAPAAFACPDCNKKDCPHAAAGKADEKDKADAGCPCGKGKDCKCGPNCTCSHCTAKRAAEKKDQKKT